MKTSRSLTIKISSVVVIALLILGYGFLQARNLIMGPEITVLTPKNGDDLTDPLIIIAGSASNITRISLDDRQIFVDKHGAFSEKLLVPSGYTIIKLEAQDKFGRTTQKLIELNYTASSSVSLDVATSSATSTDATGTSGASTSTQVFIR
jgi:hypothetical protein